MVYSLKLYLASSILFSIGTYTFLGFKNIITKSENFSRYMQEIVSCSIIIMFYSVIYMIKTILIDYNKNSPLVFWGVMSVQVLFIFFIFFIAKSNDHKTIWSSKRFKLLISIVSTILTIILIFDAPLLIYRLSLLFYLTSNLNLFRVVFTKSNKDHLTGIYFMLLSNITVLIANLLYPKFNINLILIITIGLQVVTVLGMMLFYSSYHLKQLSDSKSDLANRNDELKDIYLKLKNTVFVDQITGLPNKNAFLDSIKLGQSYQTIALINIKNFKHINQLLGFNKGNEFLKEISGIIANRISETTNLYRYDSDQFLMVSNRNTHSFIKVFECFRSTDIIIDSFHADFYCSLIEYNHHSDVLELLNMLEVGLKKARISKNRIYHLDQESYNQSKDTMALTLKLKQAIKESCFEIYYQPKYSMADESIVSYEALIRWFDDDKFISPAIFIPMAEEEDFIEDISKIVICKVFDLMTINWHKHRTISINLSVHQLIDDAFIDYIIDTADLYNINCNEVILEVTESMLQGNLERVQYSITRLKHQGFKLSLDDFGSGASSLYRFAKLDFDEVKFDRSFVTDMARDEKVYTTFKKTVELFKAYDMTIVAEGIETKDQLDILRPLDIDQIQGFYYSKALPFEDIIKL